MRDVTTQDPCSPDPLPHFAPFFLDEGLRKRWELTNARRAEAGDLFARPNVGFHHNPMKSAVSYLYVVESPNHPGEVKIGMTDRARPEERVREAARDPAFRNDPDARLVGYVMMKNVRARRVEAAAHQLLSGLSSQEGAEKEWFRLSAGEAMSAIELAARHYADPARVKTVSRFVEAWEDPTTVLILDDLTPDLLDETTAPVMNDPAFDPETAGVAMRLFEDLTGVSVERKDRRGDAYRRDLIFVPIVPAPEKYYWDAAAYLIPLRARLLGDDHGMPAPESLDMTVPSIDFSDSRHARALQNRAVVGVLSRSGDLGLSLSLGRCGFDPVSRSADQLYETDVLNAPVMSRITDLYREIREHVSASVPHIPGPPHEETARDRYLHSLCARLVALRPEEITPRKAQELHANACRRAGTPSGLSVCPVELCEIVRPALERCGHATSPPADREEPSPA
jgi:hypothetical protein